MELNSRLLPGTDPSPDSGWGPANVVNECHPIKDCQKSCSALNITAPIYKKLDRGCPKLRGNPNIYMKFLTMSYEAERNFSKLFNNKLQILRH